VQIVRTPNTHGGMMNAVLADPESTMSPARAAVSFFPEFLFATDAMYSVAKILEMMAVTGWRIGQVDASSPAVPRGSQVFLARGRRKAGDASRDACSEAFRATAR
jgi:hypothetical protein